MSLVKFYNLHANDIRLFDLLSNIIFRFFILRLSPQRNVIDVAWNMIIPECTYNTLYRQRLRVAIVYATRVANIHTSTECNEWQQENGIDAYTIFAVNGKFSVTSSSFGIRIALPSFRFHFGKQLRPEIRKWEMYECACIQWRADKRFVFYDLQFGFEMQKTNEWGNREWTDFGKSQLDPLLPIWMHFVHILHIVCAATTNEKKVMAMVTRQIWILYESMHRNDNEKELKIEIACGWVDRSRTPRKKKEQTKGRGFCGVVCQCIRFGSLHYAFSLLLRLIASSILCSEFIHMAKKKQGIKPGTHDANKALTIRVENMHTNCVSDTLSKCMQILIHVCECENPRVLTRHSAYSYLHSYVYVWHWKTFNAAEW